MSTPSIEAVRKWVYICARCNSCKFIFRDYQDCCPAGNYFWFEPYWASGKNLIARSLMEGDYEMSESVAEKIYSCVLCGNCESQCEQEVGDHLVEIFEALRAEAIEKGFGPMPQHVTFKENVEKVHNPYGESHESRFSEDYMKRHLKDKAEVVYFVGCTSAYREKDVVRHTISILEKMGIDFAILKDEFCCGSPLITTGQLSEARELAEHNIKLIEGSGAKIVIISCAGCYRTFKKQYIEKFGLDFPFKVQHFSEFLGDNLKKLKFKSGIKGRNIKVTYHDPCHLGRHVGVYEPPRDVLKALPGIELIEMPRNREIAWCCGAGAGVKSAFKDFALETAKTRIVESEKTGASVLVTCCPFCELNLGDAIADLGSSMSLKDLCELVDDYSE
ncbi:MAG: (Fe-S)-binding protein [Promethearchaeota archaeon]